MRKIVILLFISLLLSSFKQVEARKNQQSPLLLDHCGSIGNETWNENENVHLVTCSVVIPAGNTLTIEAGTIVKFNHNTRLIINGKLVVNGTSGHSVYFTSYRDDSIGGDTDGGGSSSGSPGDWGWIEFAPSSDDTSTISYAVIRYGGYSNAISPYTIGDLYVHDASPTIQNSTLGNSRGDGAYVESSGMGASQPTFSGNTFSANDVAGISMDPTSLLTLSGNTATGNATNGVNIRSGSITSSVTWDQTNLPYRFVGTVNVNVGSTLTIGPDMIFKGNPNQRLVISGKLLVNGSSGHSVYFTSYRDDSIGGDTNGGGSSSGSPGDWGWIEFAPSSDDTSTISYAVVRYGGYMNASPYTTGDLYIHDASPTIQNSTLGNSTENGAYVESSSMGASQPTFNGNTFSANEVAGISMDPTSLLTLSGNTATGNATNGVNIRSGSITSSVTWDQTNLPYRFVGTVNVNVGSTLTIGPDMIFKGNPNQRLVISGKLLVNGSSGHSVYFTSYRDDSIGGDTDGGGSSSGSPGDWGWIEFAPSSDDTSTISYAVIRYGGYMNASPYTTGDLYIHDASPTIQNSTLGNSTENGAYVESSSMGASQPTFNGNTFSANDVAGISMDPTSLLTLSGNTATGNATNGVNIRSGSITSSVTWDQTNLPYRFVGTVNVNVGSTLTIGPDMIFKGNPNQRLVISGKLLVNGSSGHSVYFTSYRDDSIGGDTDGGGSSSGSPGDWGWIEFAPSSDDTSTISYAVIRYGGYMNASPYTTGDLYIHDASPIIQDSIITYSVKHGIYTDSANPILTCNDIFSNHDYGIFNYTPSFLVIAKDHWWGSGTGPYHPILNPTGTGNPVSDGVDFIPWLTATCHTPPNAPTSLSASAISKDQIGLTWLDNSDENEFHLERSPNGSMNWHEIGIVGANFTSYTDQPLTCSSLYYYRVRAYRGRDNQFSEYSNTAHATTLPCSALFLPLVIK